MPMSDNKNTPQTKKELQQLYGVCALSICAIGGAALGIDVYHTLPNATPLESVPRFLELYCAASLMTSTIVFHENIISMAGKWFYRRLHDKKPKAE